jgi:hypothetical protein
MSVIGCVHGGILRWTRNDRRTQLGVRGEHAMEANEVQPGTRHQCRQALHKLQRRHHDVGGAVLVGALQLQHHLAGAVKLEPLIGDPGRVM